MLIIVIFWQVNQWRLSSFQVPWKKCACGVCGVSHVSHKWILPIWPSLHFGCATTLPPIQKNPSASLDTEALCHSFGELIMEGEGEFKGLEPCLTWGQAPLAREGENIPTEREPRDWKLVFLCTSGGLLLSPGDRGAMAGALFIPGVFPGAQPSSQITRTHLSAGLLLRPLMQILASSSTYSLSLGDLVMIFPSWSFIPPRPLSRDSAQKPQIPRYFKFLCSRETPRKSAQHVSVCKSSVILERGFSLALMEGFSRNP